MSFRSVICHAACTILFILGPLNQLSAAESQYVRRVVGSEIVIVFVHGVLGDGESTWTN